MKEKKIDRRKFNDVSKAREIRLSRLGQSIYEEPYQYWLLNREKGESLREISRKFNVDSTGFSRFIRNNADSYAESAKIITAIEGIKGGLDTITEFQTSPKARNQNLANKAVQTIEYYYPHMRNLFASIQSRVLNALDKETQRMEENGEMDMMGIAQSQTVLKMVNDTNSFIPKTPNTQINIQNNNNSSAQKQEPTKIEILTISTKDDLKKAQESIKVK